MNSSINEQEEVVRRFDLLEDYLPVPLTGTGVSILIHKSKKDRVSRLLTSVLGDWPTWVHTQSTRDRRRLNRKRLEDVLRKHDVGIEIPLLNRRVGFIRNYFLCKFALSVSGALVTAIQCIGWEIYHPCVIRSGGYRMGVSKDFPHLALFIHIYRRLLKHCEDSLEKEESYWFSLVKNSLLNYLRCTLYCSDGPYNLNPTTRCVGEVFHRRQHQEWSLRYFPDYSESGVPLNPHDPDSSLLSPDREELLRELPPYLRSLYDELDLVSDLDTFSLDPVQPSELLLPKSFILGFSKQLQGFDYQERYIHSIRLAYNLVTSKSVMLSVPSEFVSHALEKHSKILSKSVDDPLDPIIRHRLTEVGIEFGRRLNDLYDPFNTVCPNRRATFLTPRSKGGCLSELQKAGVVPLGGNIYPRMEPFVIGLFGPPGSGKTVLVNRLVESFRRELFPNVQSHDSLVYSRNPATRHWDGYTQQPIVVIDDFGQEVGDRTDIAEFDMLVSTNTYYPPMASLKTKGITMTSPIIIVTSNLRFGCGLYVDRSSSVLDTYSVWRRFSLPLLLFPESPPMLAHLDLDLFDHRQIRMTHLPHKTEVEIPDPYDTKSQTFSGFQTSKPNQRNYKYRIERKLPDLPTLVSLALKMYHKRRETYWEKIGIWRQRVCSFSGAVSSDPHGTEDFVISEGAPRGPGSIDIDEYLYFPMDPPQDPPQARVCPIKEPLKVRTITAGPAVSRVLKPLQMAMLSTLASYFEFQVPCGRLFPFDEDELSLTPTTSEVVRSNLDWLRNYGLGPDEFYLSGDYESATDNIRMDVTRCLMEAIVSQIAHLPTRRWAMWEVSGTRLHYPGGKVINQTSGQLMGSILSFPLLCLINKVVSDLAGFPRYVINGDDLAAVATVDMVNRWCHFGHLAGLVPNTGKYFVSRRFVWLNSQCYVSPLNDLPRLIVDGDLSSDALPRLLVNGKLSTLHRRGKELCETLYDFQGFYPGEQNRSRWINANRELLMRTPRDPNVPRVFGGLARRFNPRGCFDIDRARKVYSYYLNKKITPEVLPIPGTDLSILYVPVLGPRGFHFHCRDKPLNFPCMEDSVQRLSNVIRASRWLRDSTYTWDDPDYLGLDDPRNLELVDLTWREFRSGFEDAKDVFDWVKTQPKISLCVPLDQFYFIPSIVQSKRSKGLAIQVRSTLLYLIRHGKFKGVQKFESTLDLFPELPDSDDIGLSDSIWENLVWTPENEFNRRFDIVEDVLKFRMGQEYLSATLPLLPSLQERDEGLDGDDFGRLHYEL